MLFREKTAIVRYAYTKHINAVSGKKWRVINVYVGFSYIYHDAVEVNE